MMAIVGNRNSVFGVSRRTISRLTGTSTRRRIGPSTKPMKRSMPVHSRLVETWTKFSSQKLPSSMTATIAASATSA